VKKAPSPAVIDDRKQTFRSGRYGLVGGPTSGCMSPDFTTGAAGFGGVSLAALGGGL
jgi:hypothetical protein